jgi:hypothetical protein
MQSILELTYLDLHIEKSKDRMEKLEVSGKEKDMKMKAVGLSDIRKGLEV